MSAALSPSGLTLGEGLPGLTSIAPVPSGTDLDAHRDFERVLGVARRTPRAGPDATPEQAARADRARHRESVKAAEQLVAAALVEPMLKSVRSSTWAADPFKPTQAESQLRSLMDQRVAQEIVHSARLPIVDRLARQMLERGGYSPPRELPPSLTSPRPSIVNRSA